MTSDLASQIADDFDLFDGIESITFVTRRTDSVGDAVDTDHNGINAIPRQVSYRDYSLGLVDSSTGRIWHIKKSSLDAESVTPRQGDEIRQSDGTKWAILEIQLQTMETRYRFVCRKGES